MSTEVPTISNLALPRVLIGAQYSPAIVQLLDAAQRSVLVMMYDWQFYPRDPAHPVSLINLALIRAARRGLDVRVLTNFETSTAKLREVGIAAKCLNSTKLLHAKLVLVDGEHFVLGSHNLSQNAMTLNCEISTYCDDAAAATDLKNYFEMLWQS